MIVVNLFTTTEVLNETYKESWHFFFQRNVNSCWVCFSN